MSCLPYLVLALWSAYAAQAAAQIELPRFDQAQPIVISAPAANHWMQGDCEVWLLRGNCLVQQGAGYARSREALLWIDRAEVVEARPNRVIAYLEGDVEIGMTRDSRTPYLQDRAWFGRLSSAGPVQVHVANTAGKPDVLPAIYWSAMRQRQPTNDDSQWHSRVEATQYTAPVGGALPHEAQPGVPAAAAPSTATVAMPAVTVGSDDAHPPGQRRIQVFPRSGIPTQYKVYPDPARQQSIVVIDSGVNVLLQGVAAAGLGDLGIIDISTDRLVIWMAGVQDPDFSGRTTEDNRQPLEFYMEGNIVFRQGNRIITADRMYYDVSHHVGTILNADVLTPAPSYAGLLRLHADVVQQTGENRYFAQNGFLTSSRIGDPTYRLYAGEIYFEDVQRNIVDPFTGQLARDPATGDPLIEHQKLATARNNVVFAGPVPIFYWPWLSTDLNDASYYIRRVQLKQDKVFGTQFLTHWDGYELLGLRDAPAGTDLDIALSYLSKRGFGHGGAFTYERDDIFGFGEHAAGLISYWGIQDQGHDDLGNTRRNVAPEKNYRERLFWQHRQVLPYDLQLTGELGWISDRNFLEEYYKSEWQQLKDETTDIELKHMAENRSLSLFAQAHINDFVTETEWLPRLDHYWLGQPLLNDAFTWYEHSSAAYAQFSRLTPPENLTTDGPFNYLAWEVGTRKGERFATRQELDYPFQLGPVKIVPFLMGEAAHWGEDINGQPLDRLWGEVGLRASLPLSSINPNVRNELLNINGIAHKIVFEAEFLAADANRDLSSLTLYDEIDDDSVDAFRRRYLTTTFGFPTMSLTPTGLAYLAKFDERYYALRSGLQNWVTSPSTEIADDLMTLRLGAEQRWQTKRGPLNNPHIIDWITLDTNITFFPMADRDNYGTGAGLADYNFTWHVGDRLTVLSQGIFDFFDEGQKIVSIGGLLNRPPRGSLYTGIYILEGPIHHQILSASYSYRMSPKWVSTFGTTYDFAGDGNIGENFSITRIGESFLVSAGFNVDVSRGSVGANLAIEPRFLPKNRLGRQTGAQIPPAGASGLE